MHTKRFLVAVAVALSIAIAATSQSAAERGAGKKDKSLIGAWQYSAGGAPGTDLPPFIGLMVFARDGVMIESTQGEVNAPTATPGYGAWERMGPRTYATTFLHIWYRPDNTVIGILKVRQAITLDETGMEFDGAGAFDVTDPDGNVIFAGQGMSHGERITVEPAE